ncbi:flagellar hook-basal body complex protein FliE [Brevundimonas faecalis]|uniref:Flagellar hook-basal body complex protein FliE n=1 Tax=Brevundimonas faecalis TaxID=947378 RepID=A0ABV2R7N3_9CAUL
MNAFAPYAPIASVQPSAALNPAGLEAVQTPVRAPAATGGFTRMLLDGVEAANAKVIHAEAQTRAFALGEDIPVHQVTLALEEARLSLELVAQVRNRLIEGYQELMRMQV